MLRKAKPSKKTRAVELKWEGTFFSLFVQAIYAALGNRKFDLRPKWKSRVTTIYIRKYGLGFYPRFFSTGCRHVTFSFVREVRIFHLDTHLFPLRAPYYASILPLRPRFCYQRPFLLPNPNRRNKDTWLATTPTPYNGSLINIAVALLLRVLL